jgi:hypothetical protein
MSAVPTYGWFVRFLLVRLIVVLVLLVAVFGLDLTRPSLLLFYSGLLAANYLCWFCIAKPRPTRLGEAGCPMVTVMLLLSCVLGGASWWAKFHELPSTQLAEHAAALFTLVILLGPLTHHWRITEECYYQAHLGPVIERDLGFESTTNTLNGGRKYLLLVHIQQGGVMDRAGFRPYDIVVSRGSFTDFWRRLEESRGGPAVSITVASYSDPGVVWERPTRQLAVAVPRKGYAADLERELGFRCAVNYFKEKGAMIGVVVVEALVPGGAMERAGFQERDILLNVGGVPHLFEKLEQARGNGPVTLEVVPWIDPTDIAERPVRELTLAVPPASNDGKVDRWSPFRVEEALQRDLGFKEGWERLPHQGKWHGWPVVEDLQPDGVMARAGFQPKDILLGSFSWWRRCQKARGKEPITVQVAPWMEPPPILDRVRRQVRVSVPPPAVS